MVCSNCGQVFPNHSKNCPPEIIDRILNKATKNPSPSTSWEKEQGIDEYTGSLIKKARLSLKENQTEFGRRWGVKKNTVSRWEASLRQAPYEVLWGVFMILNMLKDPEAERVAIATEKEKSVRETVEKIWNAGKLSEGMYDPRRSMAYLEKLKIKLSSLKPEGKDRG